jgi:hypothetical protein
MNIIGIDPDLHHTGLALLVDGAPAALRICRVEPKYKGPDAVIEMAARLPEEIQRLCEGAGKAPQDLHRAIIEGQKIYAGIKQHARPSDILMLAHVAGAALGLLKLFTEQVLLPEPGRWKGTVPKKVHQRRLIIKERWTPRETKTAVYPDGQPLGLKLAATQWSHVLDALGLARWGEQRHWIEGKVI